MIDVWPLFAEALNAFRAGLLAHKHSPRSANTFGALLASAHLLEHAEVPDAEDVAAWAKVLDAKLLASKETTTSNEGNCLARILTFRANFYSRGEQVPLGDYVGQALHLPMNDEKVGQANRVLKHHGLAVKVKQLDDDERTPEELKLGARERRYFCISNRHHGVIEIFKGTRWCPDGEPGGWIETLRMLPGAVPDSAWFGSMKDRCTAIPASVIPDRPFHDDFVEHMTSDGAKASGEQPGPDLGGGGQ